jgi:isoleucyl-tRNA synthetase
LVLSIRKKEGHRVRQPLQKMMVPVTDATMRTRLEAIRDLVLSEVNVKELVILDASESKLTKKIKPIFKKLGARLGKLMKSVAAAVSAFDQTQIAELESNGTHATARGRPGGGVACATMWRSPQTRCPD